MKFTKSTCIPNKGMHRNDYPNKGVHMSDYPNKGVHRSDYPNKGVHRSEYTKKGVYRSDYPTKAFTAGVKGLVDFSHSLGALPKMRVPWLTWFWILPIIQMEKKEPRLLEILCKPLFAKTGNHAFSIDLLRRRIPKQDFRANRHASSF